MPAVYTEAYSLTQYFWFLRPVFVFVLNVVVSSNIGYRSTIVQYQRASCDR